MVEDGAFSHKRDYVITTGSRLSAILPNALILPIGEASWVEGLRSTGLPRLVLSRSIA